MGTARVRKTRDPVPPPAGPHLPDGPLSSDHPVSPLAHVSTRRQALESRAPTILRAGQSYTGKLIETHQTQQCFLIQMLALRIFSRSLFSTQKSAQKLLLLLCMWSHLPRPTQGLLGDFCALCPHPECLLAQALDTGAEDLLTCSLPFTCKSQGLLSTGPARTPSLHPRPLSLTHRWWMDGRMDMDRWREGHDTQGHQLDTTNLASTGPMGLLGCQPEAARAPPCPGLWPPQRLPDAPLSVAGLPTGQLLLDLRAAGPPQEADGLADAALPLSLQLVRGATEHQVAQGPGRGLLHVLVGAAEEAHQLADAAQLVHLRDRAPSAGQGGEAG